VDRGLHRTFVIGGMTGVLLAMPPADFLMHNTTFLVAHFHNMIIPGVAVRLPRRLHVLVPQVEPIIQNQNAAVPTARSS